MRGGGAALQELEENVTELLEVAAGVPADWAEIMAFLVPLRQQLNRLELAFAEVAGKLTEEYLRNLHKGDLTPIQWLRYDCRMSAGAAAAAVEVGEQLACLPRSRQALEAGRIGFSHLSLLAYTSEFCGADFREEPLLAKAEKKDVTAFAKVCARARYEYSPAKFARDERSAYEERFLEVTTRGEDGCVNLRGFLDAESGAYLRTAIEGLSQPQPHDDRLAKQRRADALVEIARVALDEGRPPQRAGVRPHLQITASLECCWGKRARRRPSSRVRARSRWRCCGGSPTTARSAACYSTRTRW